MTGKPKTKAPADAKRVAFLDALADGLSATGACKAAGLARSTAYKWRDADPDFAQAWRDAEEAGADLLEDEAFRRAHDGTDKPVFQQGQCVGTIREYSDTLLIFLLKARRPAKYRDSFKADITTTDTTAATLSDTEREAKVKSLLAVAAKRAAEGGGDA